MARIMFRSVQEVDLLKTLKKHYRAVPGPVRGVFGGSQVTKFIRDIIQQG